MKNPLWNDKIDILPYNGLFGGKKSFPPFDSVEG